MKIAEILAIIVEVASLLPTMKTEICVVLCVTFVLIATIDCGGKIAITYIKTNPKTRKPEAKRTTRSDRHKKNRHG